MALDLNIEENMQMSEICRFYEYKSVLITGVTGFVGKFLLEKLLRTCIGIEKIYVLIRSKKNADCKERIATLMKCPIFTKLKKQFEEKVVPIESNMDVEDLGLSISSRIILRENVNVVFHVAANVRFSQPLKSAINSNVLGTKRLMEFCETFENLQAVVHVSTLFAFMHVEHLKEDFCDAGMSWEDAIGLLKLDDHILNVCQEKILGKYLSTYSFSKALTENMLNEKFKHLPLAIYRPAVVFAPSLEHPETGYLDNIFDGVTATTVGCTLGIIKTLLSKKGSICHVIPADYSVNALIAIAYDIQENRNLPSKIFHYTVPEENYLDWPTFQSALIRESKSFGFKNMVWYPCTVITGCVYYFNILKFFLHYIPALIGDLVLGMFGVKKGLLATNAKISNLIKIGNWFNLECKHFPIDNINSLYKKLHHADRQLFPIDMTKFDWDEYANLTMHGIRKYLHKEDDETIPETREKVKRLKYLHYSFLAVLALIFFYLFYNWMLVPYVTFKYQYINNRFFK